VGFKGRLTRRLAAIIWNMLTEDTAFDVAKMTDRGLAKKSLDMSVLATAAAETVVEAATKEKPAKRRTDRVEKTCVAGKKRKKAG
jgi:ribosomal silencing factor RsfS